METVKKEDFFANLLPEQEAPLSRVRFINERTGWPLTEKDGGYLTESTYEEFAAENDLSKPGIAWLRNDCSEQSYSLAMQYLQDGRISELYHGDGIIYPASWSYLISLVFRKYNVEGGILTLDGKAFDEIFEILARYANSETYFVDKEDYPDGHEPFDDPIGAPVRDCGADEEAEPSFVMADGTPYWLDEDDALPGVDRLMRGELTIWQWLSMGEIIKQYEWGRDRPFDVYMEAFGHETLRIVNRLLAAGNISCPYGSSPDGIIKAINTARLPLRYLRYIADRYHVSYLLQSLLFHVDWMPVKAIRWPENYKLPAIRAREAEDTDIV